MLSAIALAEKASVCGHELASHKEIERQTSNNSKLVTDRVASDFEKHWSPSPKIEREAIAGQDSCKARRRQTNIQIQTIPESL